MLHKKTIFLTVIFLFFSFLAINSTHAQDLADRLKGKILLQVQDVGQAWYVDPLTKERVFLGRPADAFRIMRELGLGVSEKDYNTFGEYAPTKLSGRILLRVEAHGEAYYVNPEDLKMHYLGRPADAFRVMREQGLGITNNNLDQVPVYEKYSEEQVQEDSAISALQKQLDEQAKLIKELQEKQEQQAQEASETPLLGDEVYNEVKDAVVYISTSESAGSGMIIQENNKYYALTNAHVISGYNYAQVKLADGRSLIGSVAGRNEIIDLALLVLDAENLPTVKLGYSDSVNIGSEVYVIGYPQGIYQNPMHFSGDISQNEFDYDEQVYLVHSVPTQRGNSGGPLVNNKAYVIGVHTSFIHKQDLYSLLLNEGFKLAIPINTVRDNLNSLKSGINIVIPPEESAPEQEPQPEPEDGDSTIYCTSVNYAAWQDCIGDWQYRNVITRTPFGCTLTTEQENEKKQACPEEPEPPEPIDPGTYTMDMDTAEAGVNADQNVLAGAISKVGRVKITATNETALVEDLVLQNMGTAENNTLSELYLYSDRDMTDLIASANVGSNKRALFENVNIEVSITGVTYIYVGALIKGIDYSSSPSADSTAVAGKTVKLQLVDPGSGYDTKVVGVDSGETLTDDNLGTSMSAISTVMGAVMHAITTSFANGTLVNGTAKDIFSFKVTAPASNNVAHDGTGLGIILDDVTFNIATSGCKIKDVKVFRVGGANGEKDAQATTDISSISMNFVNIYGTNIDKIVRPGDTAEYVIRADITGADTNDSLQVTLENINTNVKYKHTTTNSTTYTSMVNPLISGVSSVRGGTLSN